MEYFSFLVKFLERGSRHKYPVSKYRVVTNLSIETSYFDTKEWFKTLQ